MLLGLLSTSPVIGQSASSKTIKILQNDWVSQRVNAIVVGELMKKLGYEVEYVQSKVELQWPALRKGQAHIQVEIWQDSMEKPFASYIENNFISYYGDHSAVSREEWWYPIHVKELCPQLPDWRALKHCSYLFADPLSRGKGVYYNGPWSYDDGALIRGLGLNFEVRQVDDDQALWALLEKSLAQKSPLLMLNWTPNWTESIFQGEFVEFPAYHPACHNTPEWGINKHLSHDCGNPKNGWIKKAAWSEFSVYAPCAAKLFSNVDFSREMISDAAFWVENDGISEQQAAQQWLKKYQKVTDRWLPACSAE